MFSRLSLLGTVGLAMTVQEPVQHVQFEEPFLQDAAMEPMEMDIIPGFIPEASNPCIFQLGYSFYDFTPFKIYVPSMHA